MGKHRKRVNVNPLIIALLSLILICGGCSKKIDKPNVVFILVDQWRGSATGYAGDPNVKTPHLDKFSEEAVTFENAVSVCPVCTPYRASVLTGRYPTSTGMFLNDAYLPSEELTLAEVYKENGYNTGYIGKWHLDGQGRFDFTPPERRQGFDYWKGLECSHDYNHMAYYEGDSPEIKYWEGYSPFAVANDAQAYIYRESESEDPFFLFVSLASPHFPHHTAPEEFKALYPDEKLQIAPNVPVDMHDKVKEELRGYYAHCTATDKAIGGILETLRKLDLMDETLVVFTSDHGEIMGAHGIRIKQKQVPWIEAAGVPLIISYPSSNGNISRLLEMPVTTPDISTTLLSLSGLDVPESFEGEDFADIIRGAKPRKDYGALYMSVSSFASVKKEVKKEYRALKTANYTYVKGVNGPWLLYNDLDDPYQMKNLIGNTDYADIQADLEVQLLDVLKKNGDEFKSGAYYINEWGYTVTKGGYIPYKSYDQEPQTPMKRK